MTQDRGRKIQTANAVIADDKVDSRQIRRRKAIEAAKQMRSSEKVKAKNKATITSWRKYLNVPKPV